MIYTFEISFFHIRKWGPEGQPATWWEADSKFSCPQIITLPSKMRTTGPFHLINFTGTIISVSNTITVIPDKFEIDKKLIDIAVFSPVNSTIAFQTKDPLLPTKKEEEYNTFMRLLHNL
jgi:hypothetical protein